MSKKETQTEEVQAENIEMSPQERISAAQKEIAGVLSKYNVSLIGVPNVETQGEITIIRRNPLVQIVNNEDRK